MELEAIIIIIVITTTITVRWLWLLCTQVPTAAVEPLAVTSGLKASLCPSHPFPHPDYG